MEAMRRPPELLLLLPCHEKINEGEWTRVSWEILMFSLQLPSKDSQLEMLQNCIQHLLTSEKHIFYRNGEQYSKTL